MQRIQGFLSYLESVLCNLEYIISQCPTLDALAVLEEQERRREVIVFLRSLVSLRLPNGAPCFDRVSRRILYYYILGFSMRTIANKVRLSHPAVLKRIKVMPLRILRCHGGDLVGWPSFFEPPQSTLTAHAPEEMLRWSIDSAEESWVASGWCSTVKGARKVYREDKPKVGKWAWGTKVKCLVPELFKECFGDEGTGCTLCGVQCSRKALQRKIPWEKPK